jgi:hypothetical protein
METWGGQGLGEVASGAKTDRAQLRPLLAEVVPADIMIGDAARLASALDPRPVEHARCQHRWSSGPNISLTLSEVLLPD